MSSLSALPSWCAFLLHNTCTNSSLFVTSTRLVSAHTSHVCNSTTDIMLIYHVKIIINIEKHKMNLTYLLLRQLTQQQTCILAPISSFLRTLSGNSISNDKTWDFIRLRARAAFSLVFDRWRSSSMHDILGTMTSSSVVRRRWNLRSLKSHKITMTELWSSAYWHNRSSNYISVINFHEKYYHL